jgi:hypothetical protein
VDPSRDPLALCLVHLANLLCIQMGIGTGDDGMATRSAPGLARALGWSRRALDACTPVLWTELEKVEDLMEIRGGAGA